MKKEAEKGEKKDAKTKAKRERHNATEEGRTYHCSCSGMARRIYSR